ncbi:hypothetical protein NMG60_11002602 [Bertholletia excelsa]
MLDGILKGKFYTKCKSVIRVTNTRLQMIKRKRNAMLKHLKNDVVDLLRNGHSLNAYGRAEGLLIELNISACYDSVEQFCACILNHLSKMAKQRECPEECREAVPSLMLAAARFADLRELRELRSIFAGRYGNSLEAYANQKFVEKLKAMPASKDVKLQLLQDIALDAGIEWGPKALEQKLYNPPASEQALSNNSSDNNQKLRETGDKPVQKMNPLTEKKEQNAKEANLRRTNKALPWHGKEKITENDVLHKGDNQGNLSTETVQNKDISVLPRINQNAPQNNSNSEGNNVSDAKAEGAIQHLKCDSTSHAKPQPRSVRSRRSTPPTSRESNGRNGDGRQGLEEFRDLEGEEERTMDKLLVHYSKKQSPYEAGRVEAALRKLPTSEKAAFRARSLPPEPTSPTERVKGPNRASSLQTPAGGGIVHPKLPDYDDFVAKLQALKRH